MVYKKQVKTEFSGQLNTSAARQGVANAVNAMGDISSNANKEYETAKIAEDKRIQKARQTKQNEAMDIASANMKAAYTTFENDPMEFNKVASKTREELSGAFENEEDKAYFMGRYDILQTPYNAKVDKNFTKVQDAKNLNSKRNLMDNFTANAKDGMDLIFEGNQGGQDLKTQLNAYYENRLATDENGNQIFTASQISDIEDMHENKSYYGVQAVVGEKLHVDNKGIQTLRDEMIADKEGFMKKKDMSSDEYNKSIKYLDTTLKALEPPKDKKKNARLKRLGLEDEAVSQKRFDLLQQGNKFEFSKGIVKNPDLDSLESVVAYRSQIKEFGSVLTDSEEKSALKETSNAIYRMAQDEYGKDYKAKQRIFNPFKGADKPTVGNTVIPAIDERTDYDDLNNDVIDFRAGLYEDTIEALYEDGIDLENPNQKDIEKARAISNGVYINNMKNRFPTSSSYEDQDLLKPATFNQLMIDEERQVLFPSGITLPRLRTKEEAPTQSKYKVEIIG